MFAVGFFFLLRGINVRELRKKDLNFDATSGSWKVFVDHQKNDPLILGQEGTAQGAIQWAAQRRSVSMDASSIRLGTGQLPLSHGQSHRSTIGAMEGKRKPVRHLRQLVDQHLNEWIQKSLKSLKPSENFDKLTFHSARVGGATAIFASTHSEALVRRMGNWRSEAFRTYIIISVQEIIDTTVKLGQPPLQGEPQLLIECHHPDALGLDFPSSQRSARCFGGLPFPEPLAQRPPT